MPNYKDMTGQVFGRLTVTGYAGSDSKGQAMWYCDCECGTKGVIVKGPNLRRGLTKSCGCLRRETGKRNAKITGENNSLPMVFIDDIYGDLLVVKRQEAFSHFICQCLRCGSLISVTRSELVKGEKTMCDECARGS